MWKAPADPRPFQLHIWTHPWQPWPVLSEDPYCASSDIHAAFSHSIISVIFKKDQKKTSSHNGLHVKTICITLDILYPHSNIYYFRSLKDVQQGKMCPCTLPNPILCPLHAWISRCVVQPQRWGNILPVSINTFLVLQTAQHTATFPPGRMRVFVFSLCPALSQYDCARPSVFLDLERAQAACKCVFFPPNDADKGVLKSLGQGCTHCTLVISCQRASPNL